MKNRVITEIIRRRLYSGFKFEIVIAHLSALCYNYLKRFETLEKFVNPKTEGKIFNATYNNNRNVQESL